MDGVHTYLPLDIPDKPGQEFSFGSYPQEADGSVRPIEWITLWADREKIILYSKYLLDCMPFHTTFSEVSWKDSSLHDWLSKDFFENVFTALEQGVILPIFKDHNDYDRIFLLQVEDVKTFWNDPQELRCIATPYAKSKGIWVNQKSGYSAWWLQNVVPRNPEYAFAVLDDGTFERGYAVDYKDIGIRPMIALDVVKMNDLARLLNGSRCTMYQPERKADLKCHSAVPTRIGTLYRPEWEAGLKYDSTASAKTFFYCGKTNVFSEEWISRHVNTERIKSRGKSLYTRGNVKLLRFSDGQYISQVVGDRGIAYHCHFSLNEDGSIREWGCTCPAFRKYPKACKHLAASFFAAKVL